MRALKHLYVALLALALVSLIVARAHALAVCSITSITGLAFGVYGASTGPVDSTGTITVLCVGIGQTSIIVDIGPGSSGDYSARTLRAGTSALAYNVYRDAERKVVWGDGSGGSVRYGPFDPGRDIAVPLTMYGRIFANQWSAAGLYSDSLVVTMTF